MPREGVSFDQVAAAAEALVREGETPSIRAVRERLGGTGSPNTIHRHLMEWRTARGSRAEAPAELPAAIAREIHQELARAAATACAESEARLTVLEVELNDLAAVGDALEAERDHLTEQLAGLVRDRDMLAGKAAEQELELERFGRELLQARQDADGLRVELGRAQVDAQSARAAHHAQQPEIERLRARVREERAARTAAEREQAVLSGAKESLAERLGEAQEREQAARDELTSLRTRLDQLSETARRETIERAQLLGEMRAAQEGMQRGQEEITRQREELAQTRHEAASCLRELNDVREAAYRSALEHARLLGRRDALADTDRHVAEARAVESRAIEQ